VVSVSSCRLGLRLYVLVHLSGKMLFHRDAGRCWRLFLVCILSASASNHHDLSAYFAGGRRCVRSWQVIWLSDLTDYLAGICESLATDLVHSSLSNNYMDARTEGPRRTLAALWHRWLITTALMSEHRESKSQDTKLLPVTSPNVSLFSNFFRWQTHW